MNTYNAGKEAYDRGEYSEALQLFLEAQSLYPSPVFHYNIGLCHEALESYEQAIISYEAYLRSYKSAFGEDPDDKVNTENKVERLNELIEARKAKEAKAAEDAKKPTVIVQPSDKPKKPGQALIITGGVLAGIGAGVAAAGGAYFGNQASGFASQIDEIVEGGNPDRLTLAEAQQIDSQGTTAQTNQIVTIAIGGAVGVAGIALLAVGLVKKKKAKESKPQVVPVAGPEGAGIFIRGRF